jgi:hypothetical protein
MAGDDFPHWALRFGVPLSGRKAWESLRKELLPKAPWPDPERKLQQAKRKWNAAETLLAMGDVPAAEEEIRFALSHLARAELLARQVFPLSRPELSSQLEAVGNRDLARIVVRANSPQPMSEQDVREALAFVRGSSRRRRVQGQRPGKPGCAFTDASCLRAQSYEVGQRQARPKRNHRTVRPAVDGQVASRLDGQ